MHSIIMKAPEFYIPIDREISHFAQHLQNHQRTILSAKFGDGKSFFIDHVENDKKIAERYKFIKVYPVNYQVANNMELYELTKKLQILLICCLLSFLGMDNARINNLLNHCHNSLLWSES